MADKAWKKRERQVAEFFGCRRAVLSGSSGRDDRSMSDSTHPSLFIEVKLRQRTWVRTLWGQVRGHARREKKVPVVCLADADRPGFLVVVHSDDWDRVIDEYLATKGQERWPKPCG